MHRASRAQEAAHQHVVSVSPTTLALRHRLRRFLVVTDGMDVHTASARAPPTQPVALLRPAGLRYQSILSPMRLTRVIGSVTSVTSVTCRNRPMTQGARSCTAGARPERCAPCIAFQTAPLHPHGTHDTHGTRAHTLSRVRPPTLTLTRVPSARRHVNAAGRCPLPRLPARHLRPTRLPTRHLRPTTRAPLPADPDAHATRLPARHLQHHRLFDLLSSVVSSGAHGELDRRDDDCVDGRGAYVEYDARLRVALPVLLCLRVYHLAHAERQLPVDAPDARHSRV